MGDADSLRWYRAAAATVIVAVAAANVAYLFVGCPLDLAPDEAHYWDWSRRLDASYYSKGPLIAWLIRGGCEAFGDMAVSLTGTAMPAVRLPAVVCHALILTAIYRLASATFGGPRIGLAAVLLAVSVPTMTAPSVLMTIDAPYLCCWAWACVFTQRAAVGGGLSSWVAAGGAAALGVLAKYTMVMFPVSVGLFLLADRQRWSEFRRPGFWLMCGTTSTALAPIIWWNATHGWVGLSHVLALASGTTGLVDATTEPIVDLQAFGDFLLGQVAVLIGYWFVAWVAAVWHFRPSRTGDPRVALLWWLSVPLWVVFALAGLKTRGQPNWPAAAYVTGFVLAVAWVIRQLSDPHPGYRAIARLLLGSTIAFGITLTVMTRYPSLVRPVLASLAANPSTDKPAPVRRLDPTCRLQGWQTLAKVVDGLRTRVRRDYGEDPLVVGMVWTYPGELAFYCSGQPETFTFGPALADRHSQYDFWRPNPIADAQAFRGRTFVYVGDAIPDVQRVFDRVDPPVEVTASDGGIPVAEWKVWVLYGFRGFPAGQDGRTGMGY